MTTVIDVDIDSIRSPEDALEVIRRKKISSKTNPTFCFHYSYRKPDDLAYANLLLQFTVAFIFLSRSTKTKSTIDALLADNISTYFVAFYSGKTTLQHIEKNILKDYGITFQIIEPDDYQRIELDPISDLYGLWKKAPASLEKIRTQAWPVRAKK